jgi:CDP-diacylglycerol---serine O-phosphatidyltransferase
VSRLQRESRPSLPPGPVPAWQRLRGLRRRSYDVATRPRRIDLKKTLFVVPNAITLGAVFCGFNSIRISASPGAGPDEFYRAAILLILSMFFDLMDGRVARLTKTQSAFGLQMDSLADVISFGVAPALLVYQWVLYRLPFWGLAASFSFIACAAIRLARFNVLSSDTTGQPTKPGKFIIGLPSPPASGILISLVVANHAVDDALGDPRYTVAICIMTVVLGLLMVSTVKFRSFKDLKLNLQVVLLLLFIIGTSAMIWNWLRPQFVLMWLLGCYVAIGVVETLRALLEKAVLRPAAQAITPSVHPQEAPEASDALP